MPSLALSIPNPLGQQQAAEKLKAFFAHMKERHGDKLTNLEETWADDHHLNYSFTTYGFNIKGDLAVEPEAVKMNANLPFAAMMFKGKIEQAIRDELTKVLG
jgi:hypothetical protein